MKKTILMLAGIAVLASCAKEIAPDVYEQAPAVKGNFTLVADRYAGEDTKVQYNPFATTGKVTWTGEETMGVFTYTPDNPETAANEAAWTNYPDKAIASVTNPVNPFKTTPLYKGKKSATFGGTLDTFTNSFIYGVVPSAVGAAAGNKGKFSISLTTGTGDFGGTAATVGEGDETKKYIPNSHVAQNYVTIFKSNDTFSLDAAVEATPAPSLTTVPLSALVHFTISSVEVYTLKSIEIVAKNEADGVVPFHTQMEIDLLQFGSYTALKAYNGDYSILYPENATTAPSLSFAINNTSGWISAPERLFIASK